ncbi:undecaprenyl-diphosphate phosphatase [Nannocystis radixulma]|uniref:Undecaprenyl-diphosphatase n=1 Tax=Nannocystis radixulma TaxID=2995305 RepID=A0ABT5BKZ6_9BACT|nr:undecaprenyl-diphosphate phosphatase [Nannocystis radixulma]MDC0674093.1 undecaprenyl-diphosphate phosphatase [Nannocystis radixulma]
MSAPELDLGLAALLGALQGVAEFLPISSSGHLALAQRVAGLDAGAGGHSFNIVVHAGTLLAVLIHYRDDLLALARAVLRPGHVPERMPDTPGSEGHVPSGSSPTDARALLLALVIGTLPLAAALAPPVENLVIAAEHHPKAIGACFLVTAAMLGLAEWLTRKRRRPQEVPRPLQALLIGLAQLVAILPGISRSGSTIAAAMGLGLGRLPAARFSFLLAIPAILGASLKEALDLMKEGLPAVDPLAFVVGFFVSFVVGVATLRVLLVLLVRVGVVPFVPYLVVLGLAVLALG